MKIFCKIFKIVRFKVKKTIPFKLMKSKQCSSLSLDDARSLSVLLSLSSDFLIKKSDQK